MSVLCSVCLKRNVALGKLRSNIQNTQIYEISSGHFIPVYGRNILSHPESISQKLVNEWARARIFPYLVLVHEYIDQMKLQICVSYAVKYPVSVIA